MLATPEFGERTQKHGLGYIQSAIHSASDVGTCDPQTTF